MGRPRLYSDDEREQRHRDAKKRYADKKRQERIEQGLIRPRLSAEEACRRNKESSIRYKKLNRERINERARVRAQIHRRENQVPVHQKYNSEEERYKAKLTRSQKWKLANPDTVMRYSITSDLARSMGVNRLEVPPELIETKLAILKVTRKIKELSK